jgi:hypothetical protein
MHRKARAATESSIESVAGLPAARAYETTRYVIRR